MSRERWLAVGGSPCVSRFLRTIEGWTGRIATVNKGLRIVQRPDVYFIADPSALREGGRAEAISLARAGVRVVTIDNRLPEASESIPAEGGPFKPFTRGRYSDAPLTGAFLVQWFANMEPPPFEVHLLGFEGYRSSEAGPAVDHWDGSKRTARAGGHTDGYGRMMNSIFEQTPEVRWIVYGDPAWTVDGWANVERMP